MHWKHLCYLGVHAQAQATCLHFLTFVKYYNTLETKEINVLNDILKDLRFEQMIDASSATTATVMDTLTNDVGPFDSLQQQNVKLLGLQVSNCSDMKTQLI